MLEKKSGTVLPEYEGHSDELPLCLWHDPCADQVDHGTRGAERSECHREAVHGPAGKRRESRRQTAECESEVPRQAGTAGAYRGGKAFVEENHGRSDCRIGQEREQQRI